MATVRTKDELMTMLADNTSGAITPSTMRDLVESLAISRDQPWLGLVEQATDPAPSGVADYVWLKNDGTFWITSDGVATEVGAGGGGGADFDDVTIVGPLRIGPAITPATLPAIPTVTADFDPGSDAPVVRVMPHLNGSIIGGMVPGTVTNGGNAAGSANEIRVIRNMGAAADVDQCNLIILQDNVGSSYPFHLGSRQPFVVVPNLESVTVQFDPGQNKWFLISPTVAGTSALPRSITPAVMATGSVNNWDPVNATTGLNFKYVNWIKAQGQVGTELTGLKGGTVAGSAHGVRLLLTNYGSGFTVKHNSPSSSAGNKIMCPGSADYILPGFGSVWLVYDNTNGVWLIESCRIGGQ